MHFLGDFMKYKIIPIGSWSGEVWWAIRSNKGFLSPSDFGPITIMMPYTFASLKKAQKFLDSIA